MISKVCCKVRLMVFIVKYLCIWKFCLFGVFRPSRGFFTHMETSPLLLKSSKFLPILITHIHIEQWEFFSVPHLLRHGTSVYNVPLRYPWHSRLLSSVWQRSWCRNLFQRLRYVTTGIRTLNLPNARRTR